MKVLPGGGKKSPNAFDRERHALLAKIHIAKKQIGMSDDAYEGFLLQWRLGSAAAASIQELEAMVARMKELGWKPQRKKLIADSQVRALKERIASEIPHIENGAARLRGLVKKIAKVEDIRFVRDPGQLKQVLAALGAIRGKEGPR